VSAIDRSLERRSLLGVEATFLLSGQDWATVAQLAVAVGTALLAAATWRLARSSRDQAKSTNELAKMAQGQLAVPQKQLAATGAPHLAIDEDHGGVRAADDGVMAVARNLGAVDAQIRHVTLNTHADALPGVHNPAGVIEAGDLCSFFFAGATAPDGDLEAHLLIRYDGPGSGARRDFLATLRAGGERWTVVREQTTEL
jgi:hypothetical protein